MDFLGNLLFYLSLFLFTWALVRSLISIRQGSNRLPPGPAPWPVVGNLFKIGTKPHKSLAELAKSYGPIMTLRLGHTTTVIISSAAMAREVLQKHDISFSNRSNPDAATAHHHYKFSVVWLPVSSRWRNLRKICNSQLFTAQRIDATQHLRHRKVEELLAEVGESCRVGGVVDLGRVAFRTSLNILSNAIFSVDLADPNSETARELKEAVGALMLEIGKHNLVDYFPVLRKIDPQGIRRRTTVHFKKIVDLLDSIIDQRLNLRKIPGAKTSSDVLDVLLNISEDVNSEKIDISDIQHLLVDIFGAGTDTTASTLEWAMTELLHKPETLAKAQAELEQIVGRGNPVKESDISRLPYLQAVLKETFRMHPAAPFLVPRRVDTDVEICGFTVPSGARVLVNAWAIGRDPCTWESPESFVPERFLGSEVDVKGHHSELIPFGAGRRICPGLPLAVRIVPFILASLVHSFGWKLEDGMVAEKIDMEDRFGLTLQKAKPLRAIPLQH